MALKYWLPLNGDLSNHGIEKVTGLSATAVVDASGKTGACYRFDGTTTVKGTITTDMIQGNKPWTITAWYYRETGSSYYPVFCISVAPRASSTKGICLHGQANRLEGGNGVKSFDLSGGTIAPMDTWAHVAVTYDGQKIRRYINGVYANHEVTFTEGFSNDLNTLTVGGFWGPLFVGKICDFRLYDEALSVAQIQEIARALVVHYDFNDDMPATLKTFDASGYQRNGISASGRMPTPSPDTMCGNASYNFGSSGKSITGVPLPFVTNGSVVWWQKGSSSMNQHLLMWDPASSMRYIMATTADHTYYHRFVAGTNQVLDKQVYIDGVLTLNPPRDDKWHFFALTGVDLSTWTKFQLGDYSSYPTVGKIADFRIYNTELSATDVQNMYTISSRISKEETAISRWFVQFNANNGIEKTGTWKFLDYLQDDYELGDGSKWRLVFYHNNNGGLTLFADLDEAKHCATLDKYSMLDKIDDSWKVNGKYEFILAYNEQGGKYNRWRQTSALDAESVSGFEAVNIDLPGTPSASRTFGGLHKSSNTSVLYNGTVQSAWWWAIGANKKYDVGIPGAHPAVCKEEVYLFIRVDGTPYESATGINGYLADFKDFEEM